MKQTFFGKIMACCGILASIIYLSNLTSGFIEFIPDQIPIIGNIDEFSASAFLLYCLNYLGLNIFTKKTNIVDKQEKN